MSDDDLLAMLRMICDRGERSDPLDSTAVSRRLGWSDAVTASSLGEARARLLIWGIRVGGTPAPRFDDIELTVQGRRLLHAAGRDAGRPLAGRSAHLCPGAAGARLEER